MKLNNLPQGTCWDENNYLVIGYGLDKDEAEDMIEKLKFLASDPPGSIVVIVPHNPNCELHFIKVERRE